MNNQERKPLLVDRPYPHNNRSREDDGSRSSSEDENWSGNSTSSYYSDSDSSVPEWEPNVQAGGELVYIVCNLKKDSSLAHQTNVLSSKSEESNEATVGRGGFKRQSVRRNSRGKLSKILKQRNSTQLKSKLNKDGMLSSQNHNVKSQSLNPDNSVTSSTGKVTFSESQEGEVKEITMEIDFANRLRYGRRISQFESLIGISTNVFDDGKRIMVSGIMPDGQAINQRQIKIGDWVKSIDGQDVTADNIEQLFSNYADKKVQVKLVFQRVAGTEVSEDVLRTSKNHYSDLVRHLTDVTNEHEVVLTQILRDLPVSIIYLTTDGLTEDGPENEGVLYCYPRPEKHNFLCTSRGAFVTLNHLIPEVMKHSKPITSTVFVKDCYVNVAYTSKGSELMLLALPDKRCNLFELSHVNAELVRMLEFCYQSLDNCFKSGANAVKLDHLFSRLFAQILSCGYGWDAQRSVRLENVMSLSESIADPLFEQCLPMAQTVNLPWEAHLQIDDALTELEAADYREWNDDPFDCQRLFIVIGTCLYYSGHLLASHLQDTDLMDVQAFLRMQGFLSVSREDNLQHLVVWKEVFVSSCNRGVQVELQSRATETYKVPVGRWFIVVIGKGNFLLVTLLEAGGAAVKAIGDIPPSAFYVEECESCLDLLIDVGLDKFLQQWFQCNARPQVITRPDRLVPSMKAARDFSPFAKKNPSPISKKSPEIQSILKRRHHSNEQINNSQTSSSDGQTTTPTASQSQCNINSAGQWPKNTSHAGSNLDTTYSEDSESQKSISEAGEERVQGRRVARERESNLNANSFSSDSDGEWEGYEATSQISGSYDMSDLSHSLMQKMGVVLPTKISAGEENVCFHFVKLECERGVLLAPTLEIQKESDSELYRHILTNFRKASQRIHTLLQNTIRFKKMLSPSSSVNKSLVAIKEHGVLFEVPSDLIGHQTSKKPGEFFNYWVVGRLFDNHQAAEVYVCYHDSVPQNMVEIAFRLASNA